MKTRDLLIPGLLILSLSFLNTPSFSQHQHEAPSKEIAEPQTQAAAGEEESTVEIEPEKQQLIGVRTVAAAVKPLQKTIRTVGRIEYDERLLATVNTKFEGWIEKLYIDYTGKYVKKGEPLAEIYSPELVATQQEFLNVLKWAKQNTEHRTQNTDSNPPSPPFAKGGDTAVESPPLEKGAVGGFSDSTLSSMLSRDAERIVDAARQRLKLWDITDEQIDKIKESGNPLRTLTVYSPVNGYVVQKTALQGMRVMPGEKMFDLADLSTVWVISDIYEYELGLIKVGQAADISLSYFPGKVFSSTIDYIYPSLSADTRTAKVRFTIKNTSGQLKPQMYTNVEIRIDMGKRLVIPDEAVIDTGTRQIIYVDKGEGYFEPREVHLGLRAAGMTEVLHGVEAGEKVASSGTFLIDSEAQLKGVKPVKKLNSEQ
jgi:Cu(I)/Ag(I) efflux system membrane fusion protein